MTIQSFIGTRQTSRPQGTPIRRASDRGVVLIVVMLVLVVMALAAGALIRSVDVANLAAGNLSFKQSALSATDVGVEASLATFRTNAFLATELETRTNKAAYAYYATSQPTDARGVPNLLLNTTAYDAAHGTNCFWATPTWAATRVPCTSAEPAGSMGQVRFLIDRQCIVDGPYNVETCNLVENGGGVTGGSDVTQHTGVEDSPVYRVTVRLDGPKNTVSYTQVVFRP